MANESRNVSSGAAVKGDNPIRRLEDDALQRTVAARSFAKQVLGLDASEGAVVGVLGAWGSGKTSFVNLARPEFERADVPVLEFNPWMFSGAQQLVESFFFELSAQLKLRPSLSDVGKNLAEYGEFFSGLGWIPLVGSWIERLRIVMSAVGKSMESRKEGVGARRAKLEKTLARLDKPIIIFLDDIDRLSSSEIRDIFKLIRLTASFPNLVYVVAFDRKRVEEALGEQGVPGRNYLEKILQIVVDLPVIPAEVLMRRLLSEVDSSLAGVANPGPFDENAWADIFAEIVRPLIHNMRDVRRYAAAVRGTIMALDGQVALADVLALEAVRVFLPDVFTNLHGAVAALTTTSGLAWSSRDDPPELKAQVEKLIKSGEGNSEIVREMIRRLFPTAQRHIGGSHYGADWKNRWLRERRVADENILRFYLERTVGQGLRNFTDAEQARARLKDRKALDEYLRALDRDRLQDVIASLETYEDEFRPEHVVPTTIVLLNLLPDLPERPRGMFEIQTQLVVGRVTLRLMRSLKDLAKVEAAVKAILPELKSLSSELQLIIQVGHVEGAGHRLVSKEAAAKLEAAWRDEVRHSPVERLVQEKDVGGILFRTKRDAGPTEDPLTVRDSPQLTLAILRSARKELLRQTMGSRAVRRSPRLEWDALVELYGDEATLRKRIEELRATHPEGVDDLLALADKYLGGWRPKALDDEDD